MGRVLAACGWLAQQLRRPFARGPLARATAFGPILGAAILLLLAALPIAVPLSQPQPIDIGVQRIFDGEVAEPGTWVRIEGRLFPLDQEPTGTPGEYALLVDAERLLRSIVAVADHELPRVDPAAVQPTALTGHLRAAPEVAVDVDELPIEATEAGTPPRVIEDLVLELDATPLPARSVWWPLSIVPLVLAGMVLVGWRRGYPVFMETKEIDVLSSPLGAGERLPAAWAGRLGPNRSALDDPAATLLMVRPGPSGTVLTAQPLSDDGRPAPAPVTIGGGWTTGRIGYVHTVRESVPALAVRAELVDAIFLFARVAERDRVAALVTVRR